MEVKLSKDDVAEIEGIIETSQVANYIKNQSRLKFNVGDILIKKYIHYDYEADKEFWKTEVTNDRNPLPRRYVYVHEDATGIGFIKRLKVTTGELGTEIICLADVDLSRERYEVDPLYLDSMLIGDGSFDIKDLQKKEQQRKKEIATFNRAAAFSSEKISEINKFLLSNFSKGSKIYYHSTAYNNSDNNFLGTYCQEETINSIKEKYISRMSEQDKSYHSEIIDDKTRCDSTKFVEITIIDSYGDKDIINSFDLINDAIYTNKPRSIFGEE